jgi:hypothetical protein
MYPKVSGLGHNEINNNNKHSFRSNKNSYDGKKLTRLTHKIAIQLHLVGESCTIFSSRSRRPVRKLLYTPSYIYRMISLLICIRHWNLCLFITEKIQLLQIKSTLYRRNYYRISLDIHQVEKVSNKYFEA